jgi:hypothetical protein
MQSDERCFDTLTQDVHLDYLSINGCWPRTIFFLNTIDTTKAKKNTIETVKKRIRGKTNKGKSLQTQGESSNVSNIGESLITLQIKFSHQSKSPQIHINTMPTSQ